MLHGRSSLQQGPVHGGSTGSGTRRTHDVSTVTTIGHSNTCRTPPVWVPCYRRSARPTQRPLPMYLAVHSHRSQLHQRLRCNVTGGNWLQRPDQGPPVLKGCLIMAQADCWVVSSILFTAQSQHQPRGSRSSHGVTYRKSVPCVHGCASVWQDSDPPWTCAGSRECGVPTSCRHIGR